MSWLLGDGLPGRSLCTRQKAPWEEKGPVALASGWTLIPGEGPLGRAPGWVPGAHQSRPEAQGRRKRGEQKGAYRGGPQTTEYTATREGVSQYRKRGIVGCEKAESTPGKPEGQQQFFTYNEKPKPKDNDEVAHQQLPSCNSAISFEARLA